MGAIFNLRRSTTRLQAAESLLDPREPSASHSFDALLIFSAVGSGFFMADLEVGGLEVGWSEFRADADTLRASGNRQARAHA